MSWVGGIFKKTAGFPVQPASVKVMWGRGGDSVVPITLSAILGNLPALDTDLFQSLDPKNEAHKRAKISLKKKTNNTQMAHVMQRNGSTTRL